MKSVNVSESDKILLANVLEARFRKWHNFAGERFGSTV